MTALARLLADVRGSDYGEQTLRDAYEAGREDAARTRGSEARYRRAVCAAVTHYRVLTADYADEASRCSIMLLRDPRAWHAATAQTWERRAKRAANAARRARAILARLTPPASEEP